MTHGTRERIELLSLSPTGVSPSMLQLSKRVQLATRRSRVSAPQPRRSMLLRFRLFPFRSPLLWESRLISFPRGTKMVQFSRFASSHLFGYFSAGSMAFSHRGFPIRKSSDQSLCSGSPKLIAAIHVLLRLPTPPCTLR